MKLCYRFKTGIPEVILYKIRVHTCSRSFMNLADNSLQYQFERFTFIGPCLITATINYQVKPLLRFDQGERCPQYRPKVARCYPDYITKGHLTFWYAFLTNQ